MVVGTFAGRSEVVETAGALGADVADWSFTAGDSFAGWEAAAGTAADGEDEVEARAGADALAGRSGEGSALVAPAFVPGESCSWAAAELPALVGGVVVDASEELEGGSDVAEDSAFTVWVEKYSAQLGSTLEGSSRHCSRSASTSH
ncbi:hypothetical protein GCM10023160_19790 [Brachybacterium paraconglomeratum]